jgi:hypothetical protein
MRVLYVCCVYYCSTYYKAVRVGEGGGTRDMLYVFDGAFSQPKLCV